MSLTQDQWEAVVTAALRWDYPLLPAELPTVIVSLVPVWAERVATLDPTVRSEMLGLYQVQYAATGWLTPVEEAVLRPYRRPRTGSPTIGGPSSDAYAERAAASPWSELTDAGWWL